MKSIDLAIIGGGCAGLSLARDIARREKGKATRSKIMVFEPRTNYENDRTWCYWSLEGEEADPLVSRQWEAWQFSKGSETVRQRSSQSRYCLVAGHDFYADAIETIQHADGLDLQLGIEVNAIESCAEGFKVNTTAGDYLARRVVDTRPPVMTKGNVATLYQAFEGVEIETDQRIGDPEIASLMAQMHTDQDGFAFDYLLPLGPKRWLVEATLFSPDSESARELSKKLQACLHRIIPDGEFRCLRREKGMIPMGYRIPESESHAGWVRAGTAGGAVRAASGYAYRRIQRWAEECARHFTDSGEVIGHPEDSWIRRKMDFIFLKVLRNEPEQAPELFIRLARGISADAMARFMMDRATILDLLAVVWAVPKKPFLRNLFNRDSPANSIPLKKNPA
jgi:lycopene beta-cyclase